MRHLTALWSEQRSRESTGRYDYLIPERRRWVLSEINGEADAPAQPFGLSIVDFSDRLCPSAGGWRPGVLEARRNGSEGRGQCDL